MDTDTHTRFLAQTVRLFRSVRLPRIIKLVAAASQELADCVEEDVVTVLDRSQDLSHERMRDLVRDAVRDDMERQGEHGWGKYLWRGT